MAHLNDGTDECLIWPFSVGAGGYGQINGMPDLWSLLNVVERPIYRTHGFACIHAHVPRPKGMEAAHGPCHNRLCFNPRHLSWKPRAENQGHISCIAAGLKWVAA